MNLRLVLYGLSIAALALTAPSAMAGPGCGPGSGCIEFHLEGWEFPIEEMPSVPLPSPFGSPTMQIRCC